MPKKSDLDSEALEVAALWKGLDKPHQIIIFGELHKRNEEIKKAKAIMEDMPKEKPAIKRTEKSCG